MKKRWIVAGAAAVCVVVLAIWPEPGIYLGHSTTSVRVVAVPGEGERDHPLLLCRYFSLDGYDVMQKWPAKTVPGTLLVPNGETARTDGQDCPVPWPWSDREEG